MAEVFVVGPRDKGKYPTGNVVMTVSRSDNWSKGLSPFVLGPCPLYGGHIARNVENAWQFSKVYTCHLDKSGDPAPAYFEWRDRGWADEKAQISHGQRCKTGVFFLGRQEIELYRGA